MDFSKKTTPFGFYYLSREYIEAMQAVDEHVPDANYEDYGRARKFYCGPVTTQDGINYFVPVSHETKESMIIPETKRNGVIEYYGIPLYNQDNQTTGNLDFRHMLPCVDDRFIEQIDIKQMSQFGKEQARFCLKNAKYIKQTATSTYNNVKSCDYAFLNSTSIDFEEVLDAAWDYLDLIEEREEATALKKKIDMRVTQSETMATTIIQTNATNLDKSLYD